MLDDPARTAAMKDRLAFQQRALAAEGDAAALRADLADATALLIQTATVLTHKSYAAQREPDLVLALMDYADGDATHRFVSQTLPQLRTLLDALDGLEDP